MATNRQASASRPVWPIAGRLTGGGTAGNERLTAATGAVLIVLLAVIGVTIIRIGQLLWVHLFVGMLLIGPLALKLSSTGYRFVRYYSANPSYRRKGPPPLPLRLIAPIVVISTLVVFASGVALLFAGPSSRGTLLPIHKVSFFVWVGFMAIHVLAHLPKILPALRADYGGSTQLSRELGARATVGRDGRIISLTAALAGGTVLAILLIPEFSPWLTAHFHHH